MIVDLALNDSGDLLFTEKTDDLLPQRIAFNFSDTNTQKVSFAFTDVSEVIHNSNNYLRIEFMINKDESKMKAVIHTEEDALVQLINLKLNTCLGDLPQRLTFGSKLSLFKHENINSSILIQMEKYIQAILSEYIYGIKVKAIPVISYDNGYKQVVEISIYNDSELLLTYDIER